jgi:hypothetical protein
MTVGRVGSDRRFRDGAADIEAWSQRAEYENAETALVRFSAFTM